MSAVHVTEAESVLLEALWRLGPLPPARLMGEVKASRPWREPTIKTLLGRLMRKGLIRAEREGALVRYRPLIDRDAYVRAEVDALVGRLFAGDRAALAGLLLAAEAETASPVHSQCQGSKG